MAVPNSRTPELALDAEGNHTTTSHYLTTGGNQTGSVPTQHGNDGEEGKLLITYVLVLDYTFTACVTLNNT
ncbi:hypothetical protein ACFX1X_018327 [Malus domestica]